MKGGGIIINNDDDFLKHLYDFKKIIEQINQIDKTKYKLFITFEINNLNKISKKNALIFHPDKNKTESNSIFTNAYKYINYEDKITDTQFIEKLFDNLKTIEKTVNNEGNFEYITLDELLRCIDIIMKGSASFYEKLEQEKQEEKERHEKERQEKERQEKERQEKERLEKEKEKIKREREEKRAANLAILDELIKSEKYKNINYKSLFKLLDLASENNEKRIKETDIQEYINNIALLYPLLDLLDEDIFEKNKDIYEYLFRITINNIILFYSEDTKDIAVILYKFSKNDSDSLLTDIKNIGINFNNPKVITIDDIMNFMKFFLFEDYYRNLLSKINKEIQGLLEIHKQINENINKDSDMILVRNVFSKKDDILTSYYALKYYKQNNISEYQKLINYYNTLIKASNEKPNKGTTNTQHISNTRKYSKEQSMGIQSPSKSSQPLIYFINYNFKP